MFKNNDAFRHMNYQCKECAHAITVWNSRDGVTPFGTACTQDGCDGDSYHVNWELDRFDPKYEVKDGDLIWCDFKCDEERARDLAVKRIKSIPKGNDFYLEEGTDQFDETVSNLINSFLDSAKTGQPELYRVKIVLEKVERHV